MALQDWFQRMGGVTPIHETLHRSPLPFLPAHFDALRKAEISVIFSHEEAIPGALAREMGFDWRPHFWTDDMPPTPPQMRAFLDDLSTVEEGQNVLVHCKAGWGRTGSAIACALMERQGWSADQALDHFWARVPPAQQVMRGNGQEAFVRGFAAAAKGRGIY